MAKSHLQSKFIRLICIFLVQISYASGGAFSITSGLRGELTKSGFSTLDSAAYWGWVNSIAFAYAQDGWSYAGYVFNNTYQDRSSPPYDGHTNFFSAYRGPNGSIGPWYSIDWHNSDYPVTKDIGIEICSVSQVQPTEGSTVQLSRGNKYQRDTDEAQTDGEPILTRVYNSNYAVEPGVMGEKWHHNYETVIKKYPSDTIGLVTVQRPDGKSLMFTIADGLWSSDSDVKEKLIQVGDASGNFTGWQLTSKDGLSVETYSSSGQLITVDAPGGRTALRYNSGLMLSEVEGPKGKKMVFSYDSNNRVSAILMPSGTTYHYQYDEMGRLSKVIRPDGGMRKYFYEQANFPYALTGSADERGVRNGAWEYDDQGRVTSSDQAGSPGIASITYNQDGSTTAINSLGRKSTYQYQEILGVRHVASVKGDPSPDCPLTNTSYTYDQLGNVLTKTDPLGLKTTYAYNDRNLETSRTEAVGTSLARTISTEWDLTRSLPVRMIEAGRMTKFSYDERGRELSRQITGR